MLLAITRDLVHLEYCVVRLHRMIPYTVWMMTVCSGLKKLRYCKLTDSNGPSSACDLSSFKPIEDFYDDREKEKVRFVPL